MYKLIFNYFNLCTILVTVNSVIEKFLFMCAKKKITTKLLISLKSDARLKLALLIIYY